MGAQDRLMSGNVYDAVKSSFKMAARFAIKEGTRGLVGTAFASTGELHRTPRRKVRSRTSGSIQTGSRRKNGGLERAGSHCTTRSQDVQQEVKNLRSEMQAEGITMIGFTVVSTSTAPQLSYSKS
jgi:hypothetical protein